MSRKYGHCFEVPFSVQAEWVHNNLDRFVVVAKLHPNTFIDLVKTAKGDAKRSKLSKNQSGWSHARGSDDKFRNFTNWEDKLK